MEYDRPTNYEKEMVDLSLRWYDYEEEMLWRSLESYMIRDKIHVRLPGNDLGDLLDGI